MGKIIILAALLTTSSAWAFKDFKQSCGIPRTTPIAERNYAENMILIKSLQGGRPQCWIAEFTLKDGAINQVICRALEACPKN